MGEGLSFCESEGASGVKCFRSCLPLFPLTFSPLVEWELSDLENVPLVPDLELDLDRDLGSLGSFESQGFLFVGDDCLEAFSANAQVQAAEVATAAEVRGAALAGGAGNAPITTKDLLEVISARHGAISRVVTFGKLQERLWANFSRVDPVASCVSCQKSRACCRCFGVLNRSADLREIEVKLETFGIDAHFMRKMPEPVLAFLFQCSSLFKLKYYMDLAKKDGVAVTDEWFTSFLLANADKRATDERNGWKLRRPSFLVFCARLKLLNLEADLPVQFDYLPPVEQQAIIKNLAFKYSAALISGSLKQERFENFWSLYLEMEEFDFKKIVGPDEIEDMYNKLSGELKEFVNRRVATALQKQLMSVEESNMHPKILEYLLKKGRGCVLAGWNKAERGESEAKKHKSSNKEPNKEPNPTWIDPELLSLLFQYCPYEFVCEDAYDLLKDQKKDPKGCKKKMRHFSCECLWSSAREGVERIKPCQVRFWFGQEYVELHVQLSSNKDRHGDCQDTKQCYCNLVRVQFRQVNASIQVESVEFLKPNAKRDARSEDTQ